MKLLIIALITFLARKGFITMPNFKWFSNYKKEDKNLKSK
jgi:hypothetical protein